MGGGGFVTVTVGHFDRDTLALNQWFYGLIASEWHNNHHMFPRSARNGFSAGQIDVAFGLVTILRWLGVVNSVNDQAPLFRERISRAGDVVPYTAEESIAVTPALNTLLSTFQRLVNEHPRLRSLLKGWDKNIIVQSTDTDDAYRLVFVDTKLVRVEQASEDDEADITLRAESRLLHDVFSGAQNPATLFLAGTFKCSRATKTRSNWMRSRSFFGIRERQ